MIRCLCFSDMKDIQENEWNSMINVEDWLHSYHFLNSINLSKVENAIMYFVMIYEKNTLIGTAVISIFSIDLDLFANGHCMVNGIKKILPDFFKTRIIFLGTPLSAGHKNLYALTGKESVVGNEVYKLMSTLSKKHKIKTIVVKEFDSSEILKWKVFNNQHFVTSWSLPSCYINLEFTDYNEYLMSLKSGYRRQILHSKSKISSRILTCNEGDSNSKYIKLLTTNEIDYEVFYSWYIKVMNRTSTKLETLNIEFFKNLWLHHSSEIRILGTVENNIPTSAIIFTTFGDEINFLWCAKAFEKDDNDSYFNLLNALIEYGINNQYKKIILGQTSYYPKMKIGGMLSTRQFFIKSNNYLINYIFKKFNSMLFPPYNIQQLNVFKKHYEN